jgi:predicted DNA-binding protein with PD1-like motif
MKYTFQKITPKQMYVVSVPPNGDIVRSLAAFVEERGIGSGCLIGIGAVKSLRVAHYLVPRKKYTEHKFKKPLELTNITGVIAAQKVHIHISVSNQLFRSYGGHLVSAVVSSACEVIVFETEEAIGRKMSDEVGLELLDLHG